MFSIIRSFFSVLVCFFTRSHKKPVAEYKPRLPYHAPWTCPCCERTITDYQALNGVCIACSIQADSMGISTRELFRISHGQYTYKALFESLVAKKEFKG